MSGQNNANGWTKWFQNFVNSCNKCQNRRDIYQNSFTQILLLQLSPLVQPEIYLVTRKAGSVTTSGPTRTSVVLLRQCVLSWLIYKPHFFNEKGVKIPTVLHSTLLEFKCTMSFIVMPKYTANLGSNNKMESYKSWAQISETITEYLQQIIPWFVEMSDHIFLQSLNKCASLSSI